jgi:hypothetical protein
MLQPSVRCVSDGRWQALRDFARFRSLLAALTGRTSAHIPRLKQRAILLVTEIDMMEAYQPAEPSTHITLRTRAELVAALPCGPAALTWPADQNLVAERFQRCRLAAVRAHRPRPAGARGTSQKAALPSWITSRGVDPRPRPDAQQPAAAADYVEGSIIDTPGKPRR